jgi:hypothetical protein
MVKNSIDPLIAFTDIFIGVTPMLTVSRYIALHKNKAGRNPLVLIRNVP